MTVDEAIKSLKEAKKGGAKNIIMAYWQADAFGMKDDDNWAEVCDLVCDKMDWSHTHDDLTENIRWAQK